MPQISPMNWIILVSSFLFLLTMIQQSLPSQTKKMNEIKTKLSKLPLKW